MRRMLQLFGISAILFAAGWPLKGLQDPPSQQDPPPPIPNFPQFAPPPGGTNDFTIKAQVNLVLLDVSVQDTAGGFVSGLPKEAFTIYEDGKAQTITQFSNSDIPVTVGLIIDNSGSMRPKKPDVITAGLVFVQASNPLDETFVINFNDKVRRGLPPIVPFTDDINLLRSALTRTDPAGRTALYDAVLAGLDQLEMGRRSKKTLIVVSDGGDNISTHNFGEVMKRVLESHATIYTIGIFDEQDKDRNPDVLRKLAQTSGGVVFLPKKLDEVVPISRQIAKDIRSRYTIGYIPSGVDHRGTRHIRVAVNSTDHRKLVARTRTSYSVPGGASGADLTESAERRK